MSGAAFRLEPLPDPAALGAAWRALEARADGGFFLGWPWMEAWLADLRQSPRLLSATAEGETVLLALVMPQRRRELGLLPIRAGLLHATGDPAADAITIEYNGFLVDRRWQGRLEAAALRFLLDDRRHGFDEIGIPGAAPTPAWYLEAPAGLRVEASSPSWRVDLRAARATPQGHLGQLSANTRQQVRRAMRLYEERGRLTLQAARDPEEALEFLAALKALHQRTWEGRGKPGAFARGGFEAFHRRLIGQAFGTGAIELLRVGCGEAAIGYLYNFLHRGSVLSYQSGFAYEPEPKLKPGLVCHCLCIQAHADAGREVYDFLAGPSQYKASLGRPGPEMLHLRAQRPTLMIQGINGLKSLRRALLRRAAAGGGGEAAPVSARE